MGLSRLRLIWAAAAIVLPSIALAQSPSHHPPAYSAPDATSQPSPQQAESTPPQDASGQVQPIHTRRMQFTIPFAVDPAHIDLAREVQLFVSADQGAQWFLYARQAPTAAEFNFRTGRDGEFWFASHTVIDQQGPPASFRPELIVTVDTTPPAVQLDTSIGSAGEITARWQLSDIHLSRQQLRLQYQVGPGSAWKTVPIDEAVRELSRSNLVGQTVWTPEETARAIDVRLEVSDQAGNIGTASRRVFMPKDVAQRLLARRAPPTNDGPRVDGQPVDPFAQHRPQIPVAGDTNPTANQSASALDPGQNTQATNTPATNTAATSVAPSGTEAAAESPGMAWPAHPPIRQVAQPRPSASSPPDSTYNSSPASPASSTDISASPLTDVTLPPGQTPRLTMSPRFNLSYDVESVGTSGVARVELWMTRNGGRTWVLYGQDADNTSPILVEVEGEGVYGFRVVIVNGSGLAGKTPDPGDPADLWIAVDTTPPTARLTSAIYGTGPRAGILDIRWEAADAYLTEAPITLSFSKAAEGPWTPLASGIPNSGQYDWQVDATLPKQVYLRLEVVDQAGHVSAHALTEPVNLEGLAPKAHIRSFTPLEEARRPWWKKR